MSVIAVALLAAAVAALAFGLRAVRRAVAAIHEDCEVLRERVGQLERRDWERSAARQSLTYTDRGADL